MPDEKIAHKRSLDKIALQALYIKAESPKRADSIGYINRTLVMATLPHSRVDGMLFERSNGNFRLRVLSGRWGIPYGPKPRLLCYWLAKEIVKTKSREIEMGRTLSEFLSKLELAREGRVIRAVKEQTRMLFGARIELERLTHGRWEIRKMDVAEHADIWWDPQAPDQAGLWGSRLIVGEGFYRECLEHPVPLDERALRALKQSSMGLDIYGWLAARLFVLREPTVVRWEQMQAQFGAGYPETSRGLADFRKNFIIHLGRVRKVYEAANVEPLSSGLCLRPSRPPIPPKSFPR